jgi:hypothetical protein
MFIYIKKMSRKYDNNNENVFPKTLYSNLNNETNYKCQGSCCSCNYVNNYSTQNISNSMNSFAEFKPTLYKRGNKYIGI